MSHNQFLSEINKLDKSNTQIWVSRPLLIKSQELFSGFNIIESNQIPASHLAHLIVIGGGALIDKAKIWRFRNSPETKLVAIPTVWGSGSESNSIALEFVNNIKTPLVNNLLIPDKFYHTDLFLDMTPKSLLRKGVGDIFSHALEAQFSPLASSETKQKTSDLLKLIISKNDYSDFEWFEISAKASLYQSESSVGLIHGIAHTLEPFCKYGHAELCANLLYPVFKFNYENSSKIQNICAEFQLDPLKLLEKTKVFFDENIFQELLPLLNEHWNAIIKNPLSRVNSVLVRSSSIQCFNEVKLL